MVKTVRVVNEKEEERNEEFTRKIIEDYFLILKDGRIVGSRRSSDNDGSFTIIFEVMGINCNTDNDLGRSKPFSLQDLDPDLYLTEEELDVIMRTVPNKNHTILASPIFMKNEISRIIAFQPTDKNDREDMYLLFVHAPYLIQRFSESFIHEGKAKGQKLRNYKKYQCESSKEVYKIPDENDRDYYGGIGGGMNFFEVIEKKNPEQGLPPPGIWESFLMCLNCGKFYHSKKDPREYKSCFPCPTCLKSYPEYGKQAIDYINLKNPFTSFRGPWFQTFIPEYPLEILELDKFKSD